MSKETNQESKKKQKFDQTTARKQETNPKEGKNLGLGLITYTTRFLRK